MGKRSNVSPTQEELIERRHNVEPELSMHSNDGGHDGPQEHYSPSPLVTRNSSVLRQSSAQVSASSQSSLSKQKKTPRISAWTRAKAAFENKKHNSQTLAALDTMDPNQINDDSLLGETPFFSYETLRTVFRSKRFSAAGLENLYQRYFFKLNQYNLFVMMALCLVLMFTLVSSHLYHVFRFKHAINFFKVLL